ncbi:MAG TPA: IS5 family transposase [Kineosporiaceae bacterium]|nr:IS5 family transposase [Kineosporiaceae bacterium]
MSQEQWAVIEPILPPAASVVGRGRPEAHARRLIVDAVFYLVAEGIRWRALPKDFPPWQTVYGFFTRWRDDGTWQRVHDVLRDQVRVMEGRAPSPTAAVIDSQSVKGAATVGTARRGYDAGKKINGVKRHIAVDTLGLLLVVMVTAAGVQDRDGAFRLLALLRERFSTIGLVWADGGYAGRLVSWAAKVIRLTVTIVKRSDDTTGFAVLPRRWVVERTLAWLTGNRRLVRDYERRADTHEALTTIAMIALMSRRLARAT